MSPLLLRGFCCDDNFIRWGLISPFFPDERKEVLLKNLKLKLHQLSRLSKVIAPPSPIIRGLQSKNISRLPLRNCRNLRLSPAFHKTGPLSSHRVEKYTFCFGYFRKLLTAGGGGGLWRVASGRATSCGVLPLLLRSGGTGCTKRRNERKIIG